MPKILWKEDLTKRVKEVTDLLENVDKKIELLPKIGHPFFRALRLVVRAGHEFATEQYKLATELEQHRAAEMFEQQGEEKD